ncbi:MAG TPA: BatA and WFA domain-containing protein, partial [Planctomycetaceae bacterium]|nr:BatA and WFA domain-containing protein [Planctomycetaceae bacterium]
MSWLHPALLFGLVLTVVPIVLHLLLRARPKRLIFPALRLLQLRNRQNSRRLRLRHLWLLLLRMLVIAGLVFALSRPSLPPADYSLTANEILRLAAVVAFGLAIYFATQTWWNRLRLPPHVRRSRTTYLRGGVGLLTALLCLLFVLWPYQRRVAAEITNPAPTALENVPVAAVFLFDTSASLEYQFEGTSRLEEARKIAVSHLQSLPSGSKVAVMDAAGELPALFTPDLSAVQNRLESLAVQPAAPALNDRLRAASRLQEDDRRRTMTEQASVAEAQQQDKFVREVYLFTDLARSAWREDATHLQKEELAAAPWLGLYLIDVGVEEPHNIGFTKGQPTRPAIPSGGTLVIEGALRSIGPVKPEQTVELWLQVDQQPPTKRDQQTVVLQPGADTGVQFRVEGITGKLVQGDLRLVTTDPLTFDNTATFTARVLPALEVLVVADERPQTQFWMTALEALNAVGTAYKPTLKLTSQLASTKLEQFDVICLLNVARPREELWTRLRGFVENGGGLLVCLGANSLASASPNLPAAELARRLDPVAYQTEAAKALLPGQLKAQLAFTPARQWNFRGTNHPLVSRLET